METVDLKETAGRFIDETAKSAKIDKDKAAAMKKIREGQVTGKKRIKK